MMGWKVVLWPELKSGLPKWQFSTLTTRPLVQQDFTVLDKQGVQQADNGDSRRGNFSSMVVHNMG